MGKDTEEGRDRGREGLGGRKSARGKRSGIGKEEKRADGRKEMGQ
jgi:hypothetical protein